MVKASRPSAQAETAIVPPGFVTRSTSNSAVSGLAKCASTNPARTASNAPERNGRSIASALATGTSGRTVRATASIPAEGSTPIGLAPAARAASPTTPVPVPRSSTVPPCRSRPARRGRGRARRSAARARVRRSPPRRRRTANHPASRQGYPACASTTVGARTAARLGRHASGCHVTGVGGVLAVVLAQLVAGGLALTWCSPLWNEAKRSYFTIYSGVLLGVFALPAWLAMRASAGEDAAAVWAGRLSLATVVVMGLTLAAMLARRATVARVLGFVSVATAVSVPVALAALAEQGYAVALVQVGAGVVVPRRRLRRAVPGPLVPHGPQARAHAHPAGHRPVDRGLRGRDRRDRGDGVRRWRRGLRLAQPDPRHRRRRAVDRDRDGARDADDRRPRCDAALRGQRASAVQSATGFAYLAVLFAIVSEIADEDEVLPGVAPWDGDSSRSASSPPGRGGGSCRGEGCRSGA